MMGASEAATPQLEATYQKFFPIIREKCRRMLSDYEESQDVAQETFIRFWKSGLAGHDARAGTAWIFRTSTRLAIDSLRRRRRGPLPLVDETQQMNHDGIGAVDLEASTLARDLLEKLAKSVPLRELEMAILSRVDKLGQQEIAEVLGTSERTVRRVLKRFDERRESLLGTM